MKRYKTWVIAGVALTTMGVLAGCGTSGGASSPTLTNTISNATNNTKAVGPPTIQLQIVPNQQIIRILQKQVRQLL